jgi:HAL2 family 3'(2'),5'-bisphosphate nucleotidase
MSERLRVGGRPETGPDSLGALYPALLMASLADMLAVARQAARQAAQLCLTVASDDPERLDKRGREPVTLADFGSQAIIGRALSSAFPSHGVVAEERSADLMQHAGEEGVAEICGLVEGITGEAVDGDDLVRWIDHAGGDDAFHWGVDPIDGTKGFLRGDQFAIAVGLLHEGEVVGGVLGCPRFEGGAVYWAGRGLGAWIEPLDGGGARPIRVSGAADPSEIRVLGSVESAHGDPVLVERMIDAVGFGGGWVRLDSQVKYAAIASGLAEVYVRPRNRVEWRERMWDHAAGAAIVAEAGGTVTDLDGEPLDFTAGHTLQRNRGVLATNGPLHERALEVLHEG